MMSFRTDSFAAVLEHAYAWLHDFARYVAWFSGCVLCIAVFIILTEVIGRRLLGFSVQGADELSGYAFAISMSWGFGAVLLWRGHLRVDIIYVLLPPPAQRTMDLISSFSFTIFSGFFVWRAAIVLNETFEFGSRAPTPLATPLWIPQILWLGGFIFLFLCSLLITMRVLIALFGGRPDVVKQVAGASPD